MSSWLSGAVTILTFVFGACDSIGELSGNESSAIYPKSIAKRFEVCCRLKFENSYPQTHRPNLINIGSEGQYLFTDGQTLWSYDQQGYKLVEKNISGNQFCDVTKRENGFSYACLKDDGTEFIEVDEQGLPLFNLKLDNLAPTEKLFSTQQGGPLLFRAGDPFTVGGTNGAFVKIDRLGNEEWSYQFEGKAPRAYIWPENKELMIAGSYRNPDTLKAWSIGIQNSGDIAWEKMVTECRYCEFTDVFDLDRDRYLWFGSRAIHFENNGNSGYHSRMWLMITKGANQEIWSTSLDLLNMDLIHAVGSETGLELVVRRGSWLTLKVDITGELLELYEWPVQLPERCRSTDIVQNKNGAFVLLLACGDDRATGLITGETWAEVAILK